MGILNTYISTVCTTSFVEQLQNKVVKIAVVGLEEAGLSTALRLAAKYRVIGFDHNRDSVHLVQQHKMVPTSLKKADYLNKNFFATSIENLLEVAKCFILTTPIMGLNNPKFKRNVFITAKYLKQGDVVIFQSVQNMPNVFCKAVIAPMERISNLRNGVDFNIVFVTLKNNSVQSLNLEGTDFCDVAFHSLVNTMYEAPHALKVVKSSKTTAKKNEVDIWVKQIEETISKQVVGSKKPSILLKGITSKKNTDKLHNSPAAALYKALYRKGYDVEVQDNHVLPSQVKERYGIELKTSTTKQYDMIVIAVAHDNYKNATATQWAKNCHTNTIIMRIDKA